MKYGYARVSTWGQDLESQLTILEKEGCNEIFSEKFTGTSVERPEFQKLLKQIQPGDTLVVTKLDRFARNTSEGLEIIKQLFDQMIRVHILNMGIIENTPTGRLIFTIFSAFAEYERDMIVTRTQEGKAIARLNPNFKDGRPRKFKQKQIALALELLEKHSYPEVSEQTGISERTLKRRVADLPAEDRQQLNERRAKFANKNKVVGRRAGN